MPRNLEDCPEPPPESLRLGIGDGPFWLTGQQVTDQILAALGDLGGKKVLDLGSGLGRVAYFLEPELGPEGRYIGFDINREYVRWCQGALGLPEDRFEFRAVDLHSTTYNPNGSMQADSFVFPWADQSFDVVLATSLFTHLEGAATRNYASEVHRVLEPGGRLYASFFVLNEECRERVLALETYPRFEIERDYGRLASADDPALGVAHDQDWLASLLLEELGFELLRFDDGLWRKKTSATYQDIVVVRRPEVTSS